MEKTTRISDLTVGQFEELFVGMLSKHLTNDNYAYGIQGLADTLHCSRRKAQALKQSGRIDQAISQHGRTIVIDRNKILKILSV